MQIFILYLGEVVELEYSTSSTKLINSFIQFISWESKVRPLDLVVEMLYICIFPSSSPFSLRLHKFQSRSQTHNTKRPLLVCGYNQLTPLLSLQLRQLLVKKWVQNYLIKFKNRFLKSVFSNIAVLLREKLIFDFSHEFFSIPLVSNLTKNVIF